MADNNRITFTAFLQDDFSNRFAAAAQRSTAGIGQMQQDIARLNATGNKMNLTLSQIARSMQGLSRPQRINVDTRGIDNANKEIEKLKKELEELKVKSQEAANPVESGSGNVGKLALVGAAVAGAYKIAEAGKDFVVSSAKAYMNYEAIVQSFEVLTKSDSIGKGLAERLNKFQQDTILGPEVFKSAQTMLSFGIGVNEVEKDLKQLGDVSGGNTEKFNSLTLAFSQTRSAGRLMGQDLLQYINAGFNPLQTMAERWKDFGFKQKVSVGQLKDLMEKGKISADMVAKSFELATSKGGLFDGMLDKMGKTSYGMQKQLEGNYESLKIAFGASLAPILKDTFTSLNSMVTSVKSWFDVPMSDKLRDETNHLYTLRAELGFSNTTEQRRKEILEDIKKIQPDIVDGTKSEKEQLDQLNGSLDDYIKKREKQIAFQTINESNANAVAKNQEARQKVQESYGTSLGAVGIANSLGLKTDGMSPGQAQQAAIAFFQKRIATNQLTNVRTVSDGGYMQAATQTSTEQDALYTLTSAIKDNKKAFKQIAETQGAVNETDKAIAAVKKLFPDAPGTSKKADGSGSGTGTGNIGTVDAPSISGGTKIQNLIINIDALVKGGVNIHSTTVTEGAQKAKDIVVDGLLSAVNDANLAAGK